jgi:phage protein D
MKWTIMTMLYVPDFDVKVNGLALQADVRQRVLDVTFDSSLDQAAMLTVRLSDPDLKLADSSLYSIGAQVELYMGYAGNLQPMMLGDITATQVSLPQSGAPTLTLTGYDKSQRMRHNDPGRMTYKELNDSLIAALIAAENLLIPIVDPALLPTQASEQQTGSDWAMLSKLATRNGFELFVSWDKLYFRLPRPQTQRVVLERGRNLLSFEPRLSTATQAGIQVIRSYNYELAQTIVAVLPIIALGGDIESVLDRIGSNFVQQLIALGRRVVSDQPVDNLLDGMALAKALLQQLLDGLYEGSGSCPGMPELTAGSQVMIQGAGKRFSGTYRLRKVTHTISDQGYITSFEVTQSNGSNLASLLRENLQPERSPKKQPSFNNVVIGIVKNNIDPLKLGRVWLTFPHLSDLNVSGWARLAVPSAGTYFLPDNGTEVLVAFEHGDVNKPYVLGTLWNGEKRAPEINLDNQNRMRVITTPAGHELRFDDTTQLTKFSLKTPGGHEITLDDTPPESKVQIKHATGNTITLTSGPTPGVTVETSGTLTLKGASVLVQSTNPTGSVTLKSSGVTAKLDATKMDVS